MHMYMCKDNYVCMYVDAGCSQISFLDVGRTGCIHCVAYI